MTTDDAGAYTAVNLIPGSYQLTASRSGFRPVVFRNFVLQVGQSARLDITHGGRQRSSRRLRSRARFRCCKPKTPRSVR